MAKKSVVERDLKRRRLVAKYAKKRQELKKRAHNKNLPMEERFEAFLNLSCLPRNSSPTRVKNRCKLTGRGRSYYRDFGLSRIALRELAAHGQIPGLAKASW